MKAIFNRASVRSFDGRKVEPEKIELLMKAAMAAPSACNQQPWEFVVVTDPATLGKLAECSPYAGCIRQAPLGIAVCMRTEVWLGIAPGQERMEAVRQVIGAPETIQPFGLVACGYPDKPVTPANRYDPSRIHYERW